MSFPYDGKGIGDVILDAIRDFAGSITISTNNASLVHNGTGVFKNGNEIMTGYFGIAGTATAPGSIYFSPAYAGVPTAYENRVASTSYLAVISY